MAKFFVGQRVRIVCHNSPRNGCEARVIGPLELKDFPELAIQELAHDVELLNGIRTDHSGYAFAYAPHELEPIIPEGHRPGVKGECSLLDELLSRENSNETVK